MNRPDGPRASSAITTAAGVIALASGLGFAVTLLAQPSPAAKESFPQFLAAVRAEAVTRGIREATIAEAFKDLEPVEKVLERDRSQAEFTLSLDDYLKRRLTKPTVRVARTMAARHRRVLGKVSKAYGVDARVLVAVWGLESNFGRFTGVRPTVPVLATLAWDGRRGQFFRHQLFDALTIVDRGDIALGKLKGSWAGALGQVQFMPSSYLTWAVDFDDDGDRDVWSSMPDVFGSIGNYLQQHGWTPGRWGYAVTVPLPARDNVMRVPLRDQGCRAVRTLSQPRALMDWRKLGVTFVNGTPVPASVRDASLLAIDSRTYLVTANYEALLAYNCAHTYALSVALLADRL